MPLPLLFDMRMIAARPNPQSAPSWPASCLRASSPWCLVASCLVAFPLRPITKVRKWGVSNFGHLKMYEVGAPLCVRRYRGCASNHCRRQGDPDGASVRDFNGHALQVHRVFHQHAQRQTVATRQNANHAARPARDRPKRPPPAARRLRGRPTGRVDLSWPAERCRMRRLLRSATQRPDRQARRQGRSHRRGKTQPAFAAAASRKRCITPSPSSGPLSNA